MLQKSLMVVEALLLLHLEAHDGEGAIGSHQRVAAGGEGRVTLRIDERGGGGVEIYAHAPLPEKEADGG